MFGGSSSKQICQFYARGQCKYGNKCWNSHSDPGNSSNSLFGSSSSSSSVFGGSYGSGFQNDSNNASNNKQFIEFIKQVIVEMNSWEKNGTWLLSSLAPLKEHPKLEGFIDTSPEELRVAAYEALKNNDTASYQRFVSEKHDFHKQLRQQIRDQKTEALKALKNVFFNNTGNVDEKKEVTSLFGKPSSSQPSLFGGSTATGTQNVFGGSSNNTSTGSAFGAKPQQSAFGAAPVFGGIGTGNTNSTFGNTNSAFKSQTTAGGIFGGSVGSNNSTLFGASTGTNTGGFSGNNQTSSGAFGNQGSSIFSSSNPTSSAFGGSSMFGGSSGSAFNKPSEVEVQPSVFGNNTSSSMFGSQQTTTGGIFGGATSNTAPTNLFGNTNTQQNPAAGAFGGNSAQQIPGTGAFGSNIAQPNPAPANLYGSTTNQPSSAPGNLFGNTTNQPNSASGNLFGNTTNQPSSTAGIFGSNTIQQNSSTGVFGSNNAQQQGISGSGIFGTTQASSLFGTSQQQPANASATTTAQNIFGAPVQSNSIFGQPNSAVIGLPTSESAFGVVKQTEPGIAGVPSTGSDTMSTTQTPVPSNNVSLFGNNQQQPASLFGKPTQATGLFGKTDSPAASANVSETKIYTPMHELSEDDKLEFQRDVFTRIPLVPPPIELCF